MSKGVKGETCPGSDNWLPCPVCKMARDNDMLKYSYQLLSYPVKSSAIATLFSRWLDFFFFSVSRQHIQKRARHSSDEMVSKQTFFNCNSVCGCFCLGDERLV